MNSGILIIGLVLVGIFILQAVLITYLGKSKGRKLLKELRSEAEKNALTISKCDTWDQSAIGIDEKNDKLIYLKSGNQNKIVSLFGLKEVKAFNTIPDVVANKKKQNINYRQENELALSFNFADPSKADLTIDFYKEGDGILKPNVQELFERWSDLVSRNLKK